ncbi:MAG: hypothetical protein R3E97_14675 [Candidatus Eisenbacteria bacterium]
MIRQLRSRVRVALARVVAACTVRRGVVPACAAAVTLCVHGAAAAWTPASASTSATILAGTSTAFIAGAPDGALVTAGTDTALVAAGTASSAADVLRLEGRVRQLSVDFVYVDLGTNDGLAIGDTLSVTSGASRGESLVTTYVAGRSASCQLVSRPGTTASIAVGDAVAATLSGRSAEARPKTAPTKLSFPTPRSGVMPTPTTGGRSVRTRDGWGRVHGSLSVDWLQTVSEDGEKTTRDPRGRFEIRGRDLLGKNLRARASLRTGRRTSSSSADGSSLPEVRQLWFDYHDDASRVGIRGGRLLIAEAGSFAYLDGGAVNYLPTSHLELEMYVGRQPDWVDRSAKGGVYIAGGAARLPMETVRSSLLVSLLREIRQQDRNRDWAYLEARSEPVRSLRFYARTQFQLTKRDDAERLPEESDPEFDPTDFEVFRSYLESRLSVSARYRPVDEFWWSVSYDESSLLSEYEATTTTEDRFDRSARNGWRTTLSLEPAEFWRTQLGGSWREGESLDDRWSVNGYVQRQRLVSWPVDLTVQMRVFDAGYSRGSTPSVELEHISPHGYSLELRGGMHIYEATGSTDARSDRWARLSSSVSLPSRFRVLLEAETSSGDNAIGSRFYGQIVRSF